jgi:phosphoribosylglycinamide formyltransferase-1
LIKLAVLASGGGSNLGAILDAITRRELDAEVALVLSNMADAGALDRARAAGVPLAAVSHKSFATREEFDAALVTHVRASGAEWVALAGFMRVLSPVFIDAFSGRVLNIHPALLPAFPGTHAQRQALLYGARIAGCTVHFVDKGTDTGPIVAQTAVPVAEDDSVETLTARILEAEHALFPQVLQWIAEGRVSLVPPSETGGRPRVHIRRGA